MTSKNEKARRPKGSGGVRNRGTERNPRWEALHYVRIAGKRSQRSKGGFKRKSDAEAWLRNELVQAESGRASVQHKFTVGEILDKWLDSAAIRVEQSTWSGYERDVRLRLKPQLGSTKLNDLEPSNIVDMFVVLRTPGADQRQKNSPKPLSETTLQHTYDTLRAALSWAVKNRWLSYNPALDTDRPQRDTLEMLIWNFEELNQFMRLVSDKRFYPLLRLAAFTGMRRSEILGLMWRDVDLENAVVRVRRARIKDGYKMIEKETTKSSRGRRAIDLDEGTIRILRLWAKAQEAEMKDWGCAYEKSGLVFTNEDGTELHADRIAQAYVRWVEKAPVPAIRFHDLRHTHASLLLSQGVPVVDVAYRLGDTSETILSTYAHFIPGQGERTAAMFAKLADKRSEYNRGVDGG